ncbi:MAG: hypothetical protein CMH57_02905 [Myxococcales bacterium]|nr:hypothetical protein [Myxococcales bacterium]
MVEAPAPRTAFYELTIEPRLATVTATFRRPPVDPLPLILPSSASADHVYRVQARTRSGEPLTVTLDKDRWVVTGHAERDLVVEYLIINQRPALDPPPSTDAAPHPLTTRDAFYGQGANLFLSPLLPTEAPRLEGYKVSVAAGGWPVWTSWGRPATELKRLHELEGSVIIAGAWEVDERSEADALFQIASPRGAEMSPTDLARLLKQMARSHKAVFGSYPWNALLVVLAPTTGQPGAITARESMTLFVPRHFKLDGPDFADQLARAHFALWTRDLVPAPSSIDEPPPTWWFTQGAETWFALRTLLELKRINKTEFIGQVNGWFTAYYDLLLADGARTPDEILRLRALKGRLLAMSLDIELRAESLGTRSLDDLMRKMYLDFAQTSRPYTNADIRAQLDLISKSEWGDWFERLVVPDDALLAADSLDRVGAQLTSEVRRLYELGFETLEGGFENATITRVTEGSRAAAAGLKPGDIVQAIAHKPGDPGTDVHLIVRRGGAEAPINLTWAPVREVHVPRVEAPGPLMWEWFGP